MFGEYLNIDMFELDDNFPDYEKYEELKNEISKKNNILEMLFSLMETNVIYGFKYKSDLEILVYELSKDESVWNEKVALLFNIKYNDALNQIKKLRIDQMDRETYSKLTNLINACENDNNKLMSLLGKLHAYKTMNDKSINLNYFNLRALSYYLFNKEKEKYGLKPNLHIDEANFSNKGFIKFGSHSIAIEDKEIIETIKINIKSILYFHNRNKEETLLELIDTIHHEIRHSQIFNMTLSINVYNVDVLHAAMDSIIIMADNDNFFNKNRNYYVNNYADLKEERMARIYAHKKSIDEIKHYKKNIDNKIINKIKLVLTKEEAIHNIKTINEKKTNIDSFIFSNKIVNEYIVKRPELIELKQILSHVYHENGIRKDATSLIKKRNELINILSHELNSIYNSNLIISEKASKFREISNEIKDLKKFYDELIYLSFKGMCYEQFKDIPYYEDIFNSLEKTLLDRKNRIEINNKALNDLLIDEKTWKINNENISKEIKSISKDINTFNNYLKTKNIEKRYTR